MASVADLARLREQAMGANVDEEAVTVNTRALIDKVLARYSGDWTTLRELIQNAADASASKVVIRFETLPSKSVPLPTTSEPSALLKHTLQHHTVYRLIVSNNGQNFSQSDWTRLKRIAEGNPDETKIGAFGVGFYSVFADCEEPFVISGDKSMAFLWKGNSLFTKAGSLPADKAGKETCFLLNYRNTTSPLPDLTSLCQFLCTSLTFVGLESIELWLDQWKILSLAKKQAPGLDARLPSEIKTKTKEKLMKVIGVVHQNTQIDAQWMNVVGWKPSSQVHLAAAQEAEERGPSLRSFFKSLTTNTHSAAAKRAAREAEIAAQQRVTESITETSRATAFLRISTVNVQTYVTAAFAKELERATKKPPPKNTRIAILTSSHEEAAASSSTAFGVTADKAHELFESVVPNKHGRIFIGFPTSQTTGMLCHISAPSVIPTVERESIDLNARYVRTWNVEMLRVAGIACRIAFAGEMTSLKQKIEAASRSAGHSSILKADVDPLIPEAVHIFKQYTAVESTPSAQVGKLVEEAFWESSEKPLIDVLSTKGVMPSNRVRLVAEPLSFLGEVPLVPATLASDAEGFVRSLYERGLISDMTIKDIRTELEAKALDETQFVEFLKWASNQYKTNTLDAQTLRGLLEASIVALQGPEGADGKPSTSDGAGKILVIAEITTYISGSKIPPDADLALPPYTLPFKFSRIMPLDHLKAFGYEELQIVPWIRYLVEAESRKMLPPSQQLTQSPEFATKVLIVLSKQWDHMSQTSKATVIELLSSRPCFPTKQGMRKPADAYFPSVKLFDDLPTVVGLGPMKDKVLLAFGVRKTIELNYVFERLMNPQKSKDASATGKPTERTWSFVDLVQYLVSVQNDIPKKDIERLRTTAICPKEEDNQMNQQSGRLYKVSDLFEPKDMNRKLGLPILHWPGFYRFGSPEAKLLTVLGLRAFPTVMELIQIMIQSAAKSDEPKYLLALSYFRDHYTSNAYHAIPTENFKIFPFLLAQGRSFPDLVAPAECFANEGASIMGYAVLHAELRPHAMLFGVQQHPPIKECAQRLLNDPPRNRRDAIPIFEYFAGRLAEIQGALAEHVGNARIVPVVGKDEKVRLASPKAVFLGESSTYGDIFDFVDFGMAANSFLLKVGSKHEPTSLELARMVAENPSRILATLEETRYLDLLRKLADNQASIKSDKALWKDLKQSPCLLAYKEVPSEKAQQARASKLIETEDDFEDYDTVKEYVLRRASDIVIADAIRELLMFRAYIAQAPQDDTLETFYQELGVPLLSSLVDQSQRIGNVQRDQSEALKVQKLVIERSRLFLSEYTSGIRKDVKWLDKNLSVVSVDSLSLAYSLRGYSLPAVREKRTATMSQQGKSYTLHITRGPDLYEVSIWICRLLLNRPKQHDYLALETVLASDLRRLRGRGYNIDRILRQKEHETRVAEEQRRKQMEEEQQEAEQRRALEQKNRPNDPPPPYEPGTPGQKQIEQRPTTRDGTPKHKMPGAFGNDSPDHDHQIDLPTRSNTGKAGNIFSSAQEWAKQIGDQIRGSTPTPGGGAITQGTQPGPSGGTVEPKSSERNVAQNLANAIKSCRSHTSNNMFSPPTQTMVPEAKGSYCDSTPAQDISFLLSTTQGVKCFIANHISASERAVFASSTTTSHLNTFAALLLEIASVFPLSPATLHIFHDPLGSTIAFNTDGALFFNFHWFRTLHLESHYETSRDMRITAAAYWWIVACHELAHNLVKEHGAMHSFYAESFAQMYFGGVVSRVLQMQ